MPKKALFFFFIFFNLFVRSERVYSAPYFSLKKEIIYKNKMSQCPERTATDFFLLVMKEFESHRSLAKLKAKMIEEKMTEKAFVSDYKIDYHPAKKTLLTTIICPSPIMRVQVYKSTEHDFYSAVLADNGKLYDPALEVLLRHEKKLKNPLPHLAIGVQDINGETLLKLTDLVNRSSVEFKSSLSEMIVDANKSMTLVMTFGSKPSSVFVGKEDWQEKISKLEKIIHYAYSNQRYPSSINLTHHKKVVVKF